MNIESKHVDLVISVLQGQEINIEEDNVLRLSNNWELVNARENGSRVIGSANIMASVNLLTAKLLAEQKSIPVVSYFNAILAYLESEHIIRKKPEKTRQGFRVISNG